MQGIRRGTWLAIQLQVAWVLLIALGAALLQQRISASSAPGSASDGIAGVMLPVLASLIALSALALRPWQLAPPKQREAGEGSSREEGAQPGKEDGGKEVDVGQESKGAGRQKEPTQPSDLFEPTEVLACTSSTEQAYHTSCQVLSRLNLLSICMKH
jgi:hypothetical protein